MKISKEWLRQKHACVEGIAWFEQQTETDAIKIIKSFIDKKEHLDWANWLIVRIMTYKQYVSYAVFSAEQVLDIFEAKYPDDKRPREAIEAAKRCLENPSEENKAAADAAADAAYAAAADTAYAAAYAAYAAADTAVYAAADAAAYAAYAAAYAAAYDGMEQRIKILEFGLQELEEKNDANDQ